MSEHTTLYRKWRPSDFSSVVGQEAVTSVLRYEVANGKTTHAYLFCGSRGTGKTTCAKILAKAVNCLSLREDGNPCGVCESCRSIEAGTATDIIEMDAASNNGVDYIRDIREEVVYTPAFLKKRVYIIDEVHMLSSGAFNALLKTLEEPPQHVVFILATTELQKLPATIVSRCQRFDFKRISTNDIAARLETIAAKENIPLTHEAAKEIGRLSQGGMRDAISLLELCSGAGETVDTALVTRIAGLTGRKTISAVVRAIAKKDVPALFSTVDDITAESGDLLLFVQELIDFYRDMLVIKTVPDHARFFDLPDEDLRDTVDRAALFTREKLLYHIRVLEEAYLTMNRGHSIKRVCAEMTLVRLSDDRLSADPDALLSRIASLEERLASGVLTPAVSGSEPDITPVIPKRRRTGQAPETEAISDVTNLSEAKDQMQSAAGVQPTEDRSERRLPSWTEIIETVSRSDDGAASILKRGRGFLTARGVAIHVPDEFSRMLIDRDEVKSLIASAVNLSEDASGLSAASVSVIIEKSEPTGDDPLSSLSE